MTRPAETVVVVLSVTALCAVVALAQAAPDTFTATATVKRGSAQATAEVKVQVQRYATDDERATLIKAARESGTALKNALAKMPDAGSIQLGEQRTPIKFAGRRETPDGQLLTVVTGAPILFLGAGLPAAKPAAGFEVAVAILEVKNSGSGTGELAPAAKVGVDEGGAVTIDDYGATVIWLQRLVRAR